MNDTELENNCLSDRVWRKVREHTLSPQTQSGRANYSYQDALVFKRRQSQAKRETTQQVETAV